MSERSCQPSPSTTKQPRIERLFLSEGHNFFGHHNKPPGTHPMVDVPEVECVEGRGLVGDRFFDYRVNYRGQITFFEWEIWQQIQTQVGTRCHPSAFRRNIITRDIALNDLIGCTFELQGVRFEGIEECKPCEWMNTAVGPGTETALKHHGGLRARIKSSGTLRIGPAGLLLHSEKES